MNAVKTLNLCSSIKVKDQVSHPCERMGKIVVLHFLIIGEGWGRLYNKELHNLYTSSKYY